MNSADMAIALQNLCKRYRIYDRPQDRLWQTLLRGRRQFFREFTAVQPLSLSIKRGETVGIVGRNGSGKSTLLQMVCGTLTPSEGGMEVRGRVSALLELGAGFNPDFTGKENIYLNASILGLSPAEIDEKYDAIVAFSGLDTLHLAQPVKTYSSGMYVRLAFAVAVAVEPDILVVDEALAVGDEAFQRKCFARIRDMQVKGTTILFVSHAAQTIIELCDRAILMDEGEKLMDGAPKDIIAAYHRLIYAEAARQPTIREEIKSGKSEQGQNEAVSLAVEAQTYPQNGGEITNVRVTDMQGKTVQLLEAGQRYQFHYKVSLSDTAEAMKFGMVLKTLRGLDLEGAICHEHAHAKKQLSAGDKVEVSFSFDCHLRPGAYFFNCGCTKLVNDEDVFVHRIIDVLQVKVVAASAKTGLDVEPVAIIDANIECELT